MRTFEWAIEDITAAYPSLCLDEFAAMAVTLMRQSASPCDFLVRVEGFDVVDLDGDKEFIVRVKWSAETETVANRVERTRQRTPIVEGAAVALAALLLAHMLKDSDLEVMRRQERADYLLTKLNCAVEISGSERARELPRRIREKRRQVRENVLGLDGYVVICSFEAGQGLIHWSYHPQSE
jgi:hypothetical protein